MTKTYDLKQVKISTSILWLLNKADARRVFFSSSDIFSDKTNLRLHSLIIRGLVSGELYAAALSKLFPSAHKVVRTKDFQALIDFIFELDTLHLDEVTILRYKDRMSHLESLQKQSPFEMSEHLQVIDAIMAVNLNKTDVVLGIPAIIGKLCNFRPTSTEPKKLLELWFKSMSCLSLTQLDIKNLTDLIQSIITENNCENNADNRYLENIKFSDKLALIISYDSESIGVDKNFIFEYSLDGTSDRNNLKHNFMNVLQIFRKKFPKVLEDFKEMMLVLNSSHVQMSSNMLINIDTFMLEYFTSIDGFSNHGNRTFRSGGTISDYQEKIDPLMSLVGHVDNASSKTGKTGCYASQTINKPPAYLRDSHSKANAFGTYSGRRYVPSELEDATTQENSLKWDSNKTGSNLLNGSRKKSLPVGLDGINSNRMVNSEMLYSDRSLKSLFIDKRNQKEEMDMNKTSWSEQLAKSQKVDKEFDNSVLSEQENMGPRVKVNETRLRLNMKRQEIERNRHQQQQQLAKEQQMISDQAFKDVALRSGRSEAEEVGNYRPKRVKDVKRNNGHTSRRDLARSQSQDLSKRNVNDISASLDQLKSEILKLTSEQAKLTAKLESRQANDTDIFSPRTEPSSLHRDSDMDTRLTGRASTRSQPPSWLAHSNYDNDEYFHARQQQYPHHPQSHYQFDTSNPHYYSYPVENFQYYHSTYQPDVANTQFVRPISSRNMAKSVQEITNSRVTSPVAMSEPMKPLEDMVQPQVIEDINKVDPLTVNNVMKHNESMEIIAPPNISQDWIETVPNDQSKEDTNDVTGDGKSAEQLSSETFKSEIESSSDGPQAFYVSFDDNPPNIGRKPPQKPPKPPISKRNNKQENVPNNEHTTVTPVPAKRAGIKEKPVAFVISVEDEEQRSTKPPDNQLLVKERLAQLAERREQERQEKLEKARELAKCEIEKRQEKEMEKERVKIEKELKRKAIFEAYLVKKVENEVNDKSSRRESRTVPKRLNRAVSAAPLQRNEPDQIIDGAIQALQFTTDMQSLNYKPDKCPITPSSTKLFVVPKAKSNKSVILNAIKYCCLAGKVNEGLKLQTIVDLEKCEVPHLMVLMRGGCQYRSLYGFNPETEVLVKISGMGPKKITSKMVERFYKYSSGSKKFIEIDSTSHLSTVIDGVTIYNTLWKSNGPSPGVLLSSETSSVADQISQ